MRWRCAISPMSIRPTPARRHALCRADLAWRRPLQLPACPASAARHVVPESGGFDPDELLDLAQQLENVVDVRRADHGQRRLVDAAEAAAPTARASRTIVYGGGPMYLADIGDAVAVMGPRFVQIYGQGESPDDDHRAWPRCSSPTARIRASATASARSASRIAVSRCALPTQKAGRCRRRDRRNPGHGRAGDARLLEQPGSDRSDACATAGCGPATSAASMRMVS